MESAPAGLRPRSPTRLAAAPGGADERAPRPPPGPLELESTPLLGGAKAGAGGAPPPRLAVPPRGRPPSHGDEKVDWLMTALLFLFPALGGALFGYDIGATSGALVSLTSPDASGTDWFQLSAFQSGLAVSLSLAGALAGSVAALVFGDRLGRKRELLAAAGLYAGAAALEAAAPGGLPGLLAGRAAFGLGIGLAMHAAPAYIAETSPARVRGLLISLKEAFIVGGILAGYATSYAFVDTVGGWRAMYGLAVVPALVLGAGMAWLPDSPRWLLLSGAGPAAAADALRRAKGRCANEAEVRYEVEGMEAAMAASPMAGGGGALATIFQAAGFAEASQATRVSLILGLFKLVMTGVAVAKVDSWGRRPLLLGGVAGIVGALLALGAASLGEGGGGGGGDPHLALAALLPADALAWVNLLALLVYVRGQAIALSTLTNFGANFLVSLALPSVREGVGPAATYFAFAAIGVAAVACIYSIVPETKGRTLEEIEALWTEDEQRGGGGGGGGRPPPGGGWRDE
eukprot:scaffold2.g6942.t1